MPPILTDPSNTRPYGADCGVFHDLAHAGITPVYEDVEFSYPKRDFHTMYVDEIVKVLQG